MTNKKHITSELCALLRVTNAALALIILGSVIAVAIMANSREGIAQETMVNTVDPLAIV